MKIIRVLLACCSILCASAVFAGPIVGEDDPRFAQAIETWLDGNDLDALEQLAGLSRQDNRAAQILLACIAPRGHMHGHVTADLPRKERVALLRVPKGPSGKSWLTEAQKTEGLALASLQSGRIEQKAPAIAVLFELGEPTTALLPARSMLLSGHLVELLEVL